MTAPTSPHRSRLLPARFWLLPASALTLLPAAAEIRIGQNLLQNGDAESPITTGWTVNNGTFDTGTEWTRASGGYNQLGSYFITSFSLCTRSQTIDLLAAGLTAEELDSAPAIRVSEAFSCNPNLNRMDSYYMKVELRDAAGVALASWNVGTSTARKAATTAWVLESFVFRNYGPGVRTLYFEDGSIDEGYWRGQYGVYHDAARVEFSELPVTGISASSPTFPANVPAGGLVAQLQAADADSVSHSFVLEAETGSTTSQVLLEREALEWRYYDAATDPPANWAAPDFDDSDWSVGQAPLGYTSSGTEAWKNTPNLNYGTDALNKPITTWFRKNFTVADASVFTGLSATLMVDDGCVVYLNGEELFRDGVAAGTVTSTTPANRTVGGTDESALRPISIPASKLPLLRTGINTLAVEVHQDKVTSSDITIDVALSGTTETPGNAYSNDLFQIAGTALNIKDGSAALPDGVYTVRVRATDPQGNSAVRLVTLQRTSTVFNNPPVGLALTPGTLAENSASGALGGTLSVSDADPGDVHAYTLISGAGGEDNAAFSIAENRLVVVQPPDFETRPTLSILVQVTDSVGLTLVSPLTITVTDDTAEDTDGDGLSEAQEDTNDNGTLDEGETDPAQADTDSDGFNDRIERLNGSDPRDPAVVPAPTELRQITTHSTGSSWLTTPSWEGSATVQPFHVTITENGLTLRPPASANPVFPGLAAVLRSGSVFRLKHTGTMTIPRIVLDDATLQHGMEETLTVGGAGSRLEIPTTATIDCDADPLVLTAGLAGAGSVRVIGSTTTSAPIKSGSLELRAPAQSFTGSITLEVPQCILTHPDALGSATTVTMNSGTLSMNSDVSLPGTQLVRTGGVLRLSHRLAVAGFTADTTSLPAGTYSAAQLITAGVPAEALEDAGGTLVVGTPANADSDGDGWSDANEVLAGTDPANPNSVLRLSSATPAATVGAYTLQWTAVAGITYTIQYSPDLASPWQDLGTITPAGTDGTFDATIPAPVGGRGYFRLAIK